MFPHTRVSSQLQKRDLTPPLLASLKCEDLIIPGLQPTQAGAPHGAGRNGQPAPTRKSACLTGQGLWVIRAEEIVAFSVLLKNVNFGSSVGCLVIGEMDASSWEEGWREMNGTSSPAKEKCLGHPLPTCHPARHLPVPGSAKAEPSRQEEVACAPIGRPRGPNRCGVVPRSSQSLGSSRVHPWGYLDPFSTTSLSPEARVGFWGSNGQD